uniref:FAD-binding PCMH-type domain-containing protein n=1 Tax=Oryza meridionalis TaxID=40149 RepID=A0A0E0EI51_9ORYZ
MRATLAIMHAIAATLVLCFCLLHPITSNAQPPSNISSCLLYNGVRNFSLPLSPSYATLLDSSIQNLRFALPNVSKPVALIIPTSKLDLQRAILCTRNSSLAIRVCSGGHSYEGTAWVESGATLGELYYAIGQSNRSLAFSAGSCSTVGMGGFVSGGGFGLISRKFALAADNVLDAILMDPNGNALNRGSMGDDVFWAIRGGGGGSWGVVYAWKLQLVHVPHNITVFSLNRTGPLEQTAKLMHKWQFVGPHLPDEFYLSICIPTGTSNGNVSMSFTGQVLGPKQYAMLVLHHAFPELGIVESDLSEVSWIESTAKFARLNLTVDLTNRWFGIKHYSKRKSDYVRSPISMQDTIKIIEYLSNGPQQGSIQLDPYGGAMARIGSSKLPFPYRDGYLYSIQYSVSWKASDNDRADEYI